VEAGLGQGIADYIVRLGTFRLFLLALKVNKN